MVTFYRLGASQLIVTQIFAVVFFGFPHGHVNGYDLYEGSPCKLTDGASGVCKIIDECTSVYLGLVTKTLEYAEVVKDRCGFVKDKEVVCCKDHQPDPPISRTTPRVSTPTRSEFPVNIFSGKGSSSGHDEWSSVSRPLEQDNKLNVQRTEDHITRSGYDENDGKISSRFFLGSLSFSQNSASTFENTQVRQQPVKVRCIYNVPVTTTPLPVQTRPRIFGILNFNKPTRTTPRPSVLSPVLDVLRPIKEIPINFLSAIGNKRNGINMQGQLNINSGQSATFGDSNGLCFGTSYEPIQASQNPNNFLSSNSVDMYQSRNPNLSHNEDIWNNLSSPMSVSTNSMIANQVVTSIQNSKQNQNHNMPNIPSSATSEHFIPSYPVNGNQPVTPMQNPNLNQNQNIWSFPSSSTSGSFITSNSMNGNQPIEMFQPVPMPNSDPSQILNTWSNPNSPISVPFVDNGFGTTSAKPLLGNNRNWDTNDKSWMVEGFRTTTIATTGSPIRTAKIEDSQLEPWMLEALKESNSTVPNQQDNRNSKPWIFQANTKSVSSGKSEPLQMPPNSIYDPWMLEAAKENVTSTQVLTHSDRSKKDTPIISLLQNSEKTPTSFGDSVLDPWMKEALLADNTTTTTTTTLKPQINHFINCSNSSSNDKNAGFESWMLEALKETNISNPSSDNIKQSRKDIPKPDSLKNFEIIITTKKSVFGESVLDPWMKEALLNTDESKSNVTSTQKLTKDSASDEQIPPSVSTNGNNAFDPWMLDALGRGSKSFSSISNASLTLPTEDEWVWDHKIVSNKKNSSQKSDRSSEVDVNYLMSEALKQKTTTLGDNQFSSPEQLSEGLTTLAQPSKSPFIQHNPNFQNKQLGRENLGVGQTIPQLRNGTDRINVDLINEIFDIPENRPTKPIGPRNSRRADDACAKYRDDFGASLTYQILGGTAALLGEFPHMAALGYPSTAANREYDWNCGATLISDQYLLTSAHCITREGPTLARLGKISIDTNDDGVNPVDFLIEESIKHPIYTNARQYHDIALVKLNQKVDFNDNIRPACLDTNQTPMPPNTNVTVTGWGTISLRNRSRSDVLLKANLKTVTLTSCNQSHADYEQRNRKLPFGLTEAQMCAFDPDLVKDACEGDSGGPLQIVDDSGMSTIYGVTSFGVSCASKIPGVYARVSNYVDWIESIVWS